MHGREAWEGEMGGRRKNKRSIEETGGETEIFIQLDSPLAACYMMETDWFKILKGDP